MIGKNINTKLTKLVNAFDAAKIKYGVVRRPGEGADFGKINLLLEGTRHEFIVVTPNVYKLIYARLPFTTRGTIRASLVLENSNVARFVAAMLRAKAKGEIKLKMRRKARTAK